MDIEILKRAADGDPQAARQLKAWLATASDRENRDLEKLLEKGREDRRQAFWGELRDLKDAIGSAPLAAASALDAMEDRGRPLGTCETVQVMGLRAYRCRLLGDLDAAEKLLAAAYDLAPQCRSAPAAAAHPNPCLLDLQRRSATLEAARGRRRCPDPLTRMERVYRALLRVREIATAIPRSSRRCTWSSGCCAPRRRWRCCSRRRATRCSCMPAGSSIGA